MDEVSYHHVADETLDAIADFFEDLGESATSPKDYDVQLSVGFYCLNFAVEFCQHLLSLQYPNIQFNSDLHCILLVYRVEYLQLTWEVILVILNRVL